MLITILTNSSITLTLTTGHKIELAVHFYGCWKNIKRSLTIISKVAKLKKYF